MRLLSIYGWMLLFSFYMPSLFAGSFTVPNWFKNKDLDIPALAKETATQNKILMIIFHQASCGLCAKLMTDIEKPELKKFVQQYFVVADVDIDSVDKIVTPKGETQTAQDYAKQVQIKGTPTLLFLDGEGKTVFRTAGYQSADIFKAILKKVANPPKP